MTSPWQPADPHWASRVRESFARQGIMAHLGAVLLDLAPGRCDIALPWRTELTQQDGYFHAGAIATIADSAAGYAAFTLMPATARVLTVEYKLNLMAPGCGAEAVARGVVKRAGRTITVAQAEVVTMHEGEETAVALMQATLMALLPSTS